jgi:hypothetical protein
MTSVRRVFELSQRPNDQRSVFQKQVFLYVLNHLILESRECCASGTRNQLFTVACGEGDLSWNELAIADDGCGPWHTCGPQSYPDR